MKPEELGTYYESILDREARKEGGVYYTPQYIVDYIVEHTVGKLLEGKTPKEVGKIKIVDPACGAGIFLLGAYQFLLDWYEHHNVKLTLAKRRKILTNNIFGVDIDPLAVEITKYCLSMMCTEGKNFAVNLDGNIFCGNSLIDTDFYDFGFDESVEQMVKPFNWQRTFPDVFKQGGFDCAIGNPPYVKKEHFSEETTVALQAMWNYVADLYVHFIFQNYELAKTGGLISLSGLMVSVEIICSTVRATLASATGSPPHR